MGHVAPRGQNYRFLHDFAKILLTLPKIASQYRAVDISIVIVSYRVRYFLEQTLRAAQEALTGLSGEIIVVDNNSADGTMEFVKPRFPDVRFIENKENVGFGRANNQAIMQAQGEFTVILNPDTIITPACLQEPLQFMRSHPGCGATGLHMVNGQGRFLPESKRGFPTPWVSFCKIFGLSRLFPHSPLFAKYHLRYLSEHEAHRVDILSGAFMLCRTKLLQELGGFDPDFFMYGEDIDLSYRLLKGGWQNWYLPYDIVHYKGESTQKSSFRYVHTFYQAMLIFFRKHYSHLSILITLPVSIAIYAKATIALVTTTMKKTRQSLGFVNKDKHIDPLYIFYVAPQHMAQCQQFAKRKGVWAEFHDANKNICEKPAEGRRQRTFLTYDASAYSFNEMLERISHTDNDKVALAVYYPTHNMIITAADIIK